jgi:hypothetical protein
MIMSKKVVAIVDPIISSTYLANEFKKEAAEKVQYGLKYKDKKIIYEILRSEKSH